MNTLLIFLNSISFYKASVNVNILSLWPSLWLLLLWSFTFGSSIFCVVIVCWYLVSGSLYIIYEFWVFISLLDFISYLYMWLFAVIHESLVLLVWPGSHSSNERIACQAPCCHISKMHIFSGHVPTYTPLILPQDNVEIP